MTLYDIIRNVLQRSVPRLQPTYAVVLWLGLLLTVIPASAQVTGVSYTVSPLGTRVYWDDDAGLEDSYLYGGELGFGFGEYLELGGIYVFNNDIETDFSAFSGENAAVMARIAALPPREVQLQRYGGKLRVNLGRGAIVPFVTAGTGLLSLDVDGTGPTSRSTSRAGWASSLA